MAGSTKSAFTRLFHAACLISAVCLTSWCIHEYGKNEDMAEIKFRKFHSSSNDIYPSISLCSTNPFLSEQLKRHDKKLSTDKYKLFLAGLKLNNLVNLLKPSSRNAKNKSPKQWIDIDYDNVSANFADFMSYFAIVLNDGRQMVWRKRNGTLSLVVSYQDLLDQNRGYMCANSFIQLQNIIWLVSLHSSNMYCYLKSFHFLKIKF